MELIKGEYECSTSELSLMCTALIVCHIIYQYHIIVIGNAQHKYVLMSPAYHVMMKLVLTV